METRVQRNNSTVMQVRKQWTDEYRSTRKTGIGQWKVTSARVNPHLHRMAVNDRTTSSRQLVYCYSCTNNRLRQFVDVCCTVDSVQGCPFIQDPPHCKPSTAASAMGS
ncbi:hypothetical protein TNCV_3506301 [Trichonephila clavipes]|uniref:Uncharacterized protein n=1 Tax=Trichonephila clavipes TaxID=2585209 RepID=A0A8X6VE38_TRICX|nr:hypothetical protein TNCV_3506301 [Trichonephila clavipes]